MRSVRLAKLKFNRLLISVADWQPFVHFEAEGVKKETGVLWRGLKFPVSGDTAGRTAFRGARYLRILCWHPRRIIPNVWRLARSTC